MVDAPFIPPPTHEAVDIIKSLLRIIEGKHDGYAGEHPDVTRAKKFIALPPSREDAKTDGNRSIRDVLTVLPMARSLLLRNPGVPRDVIVHGAAALIAEIERIDEGEL